MTLASPTFGDLIDAVLGNLNGWLADEDQVTSLNGAITDTATTLTVDDATQISAGPIEIDSELLWVTEVDRSTNSVTVAPWGRGYRDTDAAAHTDRAMVVNHPRFPRSTVAKAVQQTLFAVYPDLFQVKVDDSNTANPATVAYALPADCDQVLRVAWSVPGSSGELLPVRRWRFEPNSDTANGKAVNVYDPMVPGRTLRVTYTAKPTMLEAESDLLSVSGLADSVQDVLIFGACYRLTPALDAARLQTTSVEQSNNSSNIQNGSVGGAAQFFLGLYEQALNREVLRLQKFYPIQSHLER